MRDTILAALITLSATVTLTAQAHAQAYACSGQNLYLRNLNGQRFPVTGGNVVWIGQQKDAKGKWWGVAVVQVGTSYTALRLMDDKNVQLANGALAKNSVLCFGAGDDEVQLVTSTLTLGGITIAPLNLAGYTLSIYGETGVSAIVGAPGRVMLVGGAHCDGLWTRSGSYKPPVTWVFGGGGSDMIWGGPSDQDYMLGEDDDDLVMDFGGTMDRLNTGNNSSTSFGECIEDDSGFAFLSCGSGGAKDMTPNVSSDGSCALHYSCWFADEDPSEICFL